MVVAFVQAHLDALRIQTTALRSLRKRLGLQLLILVKAIIQAAVHEDVNIARAVDLTEEFRRIVRFALLNTTCQVALNQFLAQGRVARVRHGRKRRRGTERARLAQVEHQRAVPPHRMAQD